LGYGAAANGNVNPCGLVDLDRRLRPVGRAHKELIEMWRGVMPTYSHGLASAERRI
jgi:hypothetical protein